MKSATRACFTFGLWLSMLLGSTEGFCAEEMLLSTVTTDGGRTVYYASSQGLASARNQTQIDKVGPTHPAKFYVEKAVRHLRQDLHVQDELRTLDFSYRFAGPDSQPIWFVSVELQRWEEKNRSPREAHRVIMLLDGTIAAARPSSPTELKGSVGANNNELRAVQP